MNNLHYPSLELCMKLEKIGFPKTYLSYFTSQEKSNGKIKEWISDINRIDGRSYTSIGRYNCPSVMEMLDVMPRFLETKHMRPVYLDIEKRFAPEYTVNYQEDSVNKAFIFFRGELPNALAEMILWLHKEGHITFDNK